MVERILRSQEVEKLCRGESDSPHSILGLQPLSTKGGAEAVIVLFRPGAQKVSLQILEEVVEATKVQEVPGLFFYKLPEKLVKASSSLGNFDYKIYHENGLLAHDPYAFPILWSLVDEELFALGKHEEIYRRMGAISREVLGVKGVLFTVWAPNATSISVVGDFNKWNGLVNPMKRVEKSSGVWELFIPGIEPGMRYKWEIVSCSGIRTRKSDPYGKSFDYPPEFSSIIVSKKDFAWSDGPWIENRTRAGNRRHLPINIYEVHLGSWRWEEGKPLSYRKLAESLAKHCQQFHYTHVELLPVTEHPLVESWGYQVGGYYAPTRRFGDPDDFRFFVNYLHEKGIGVILDWVPAHFPVDDFLFSNFDGTPLYESTWHKDNIHPHWGTYTFDYSKPQVVNFLLGSALFWLEEMHVDGIRFDAVASMLYLDYGREHGEWTPNRLGGREHLEAQEFIQRVNAIIHERFPGVITFAEESTSFPKVTFPVKDGGLGFDYKWNMGWMNDTFRYFQTLPDQRSAHNCCLTFGLMYAFHESFILPFSHDEVVHEKGSLIGKMPGNNKQKFAHLRLLLSYQMCQIGKKLSFMGTELASFDEWSPNRGLQEHLLEDVDHRVFNKFVAELNAFYLDHPPLWQKDCEPEGFEWVDFSDITNNVIAYKRSGYRSRSYHEGFVEKESRDPCLSGLGDDEYRLLCVHHFGCQRLEEYFFCCSSSSVELLFNSNAERFGGDGWGDCVHSSKYLGAKNFTDEGIFVDVPPLTTLIIKIKN
ncbi:1,4-alpha-glucan branching protein GlgB [Chlamydiifrater phoenicopteri]|uniref:1,4-alpha-glucan branching protein GlgB n=1 Tax=Chlamydiifrater phoenicopteri TaxID=2681469 RepID=UPI001BCA67F7|nr:1,4-alpha-glucan branching protein GlgB [Chlamydiifrater phoenicopteri]